MRAFVVTVPDGESELASDVLFGAGVAAVEERAAPEPHHVELWTHVGDASADHDAVAALLGDRWPWRLVEVDDAVADTWRDFVDEMVIDDGLVVVPAWRELPARPGALVVPIDPGAAFGLGDHPTTVLTLRALRAIVDESTEPPARVLDVGSGSGVLAVVAARLGIGDVVAIDHHAAAVAATRENAARNGVGDAVQASGRPLSEIEGEFDVVLANLLAPVIIDLADDLRRVTATGGRLVVSGILADRHEHVLAALAPMRVTRTTTLDGWAAVELVSPPSP